MAEFSTSLLKFSVPMLLKFMKAGFTNVIPMPTERDSLTNV